MTRLSQACKYYNVSNLIISVFCSQIVDELRTYDDLALPPMEHIWYYNDDRWEESVYFNTPTSGMDAMQTFEVRGRPTFSTFSNVNKTSRGGWDKPKCSLFKFMHFSFIRKNL